MPEDNYIGFSITQGNEYRPKSWSISKFIELANKISLKGKIPVFFVKKNDINVVKMIQENVPTAIFPEHKSSNPCPALVTALSKRCELGITIDNGIMHMMGLAKIPLIILFGPTDSKKFAPNYQGVKILDSKRMYNSQSLERITVDDVLKCLIFKICSNLLRILSFKFVLSDIIRLKYLSLYFELTCFLVFVSLL